MRSSLLLTALCLAGLAANVSGRTMEPLVTVLASDLSVSISAAALLTSAYALPFAVGQPILGPLGDIFGKSLVLKISSGMLAASLLAAAFAPNFEVLVFARFCAGLAAGGVVPACMATIGDSYPPDRRQVALSTFVTMGLLAQVFATSGSGLIGQAFGWRAVLIGTATFGAVGVVAAVSVLRNDETRARKFSVSVVIATYRSVFENPKAVLCYSTVFIEGIALYGILPYVGPILQSRGLGAAAEAGMIIGAIGVGGLVYVVLVRHLLKRWTRRRFMAIGGLLMPFGPLALAFVPQWQFIAIMFAVTGLGFMLLHNSIQTEAVDLAPTARQSGYSLHAFSFFTGQALGPPLFGFLLNHATRASALLFSSVILAVTGLGMAYLFGRIGKQKGRKDNP